MVRGLNPDTVITDEVNMSAFSKQEGGNHYTKMKIQPFHYSMANGLDPMQHTVVKYVTRFRDKNGIEDLKKAIHTLELLIEYETSRTENASTDPEPLTEDEAPKCVVYIGGHRTRVREHAAVHGHLGFTYLSGDEAQYLSGNVNLLVYIHETALDAGLKGLDLTRFCEHNDVNIWA